MKKLLKLAMAMVAVVILASGCSKKEDTEKKQEKKELVVWTFTDEVSTMIDDYYLKEKTGLDYDIKIVKTPSDQFQTKLDPVINSDKAPDVISMEVSFVKKYVESGFLADLTEFKLDEKSKDTYDYVKQVGTSEDGGLRALSWQATPGAFFYRASLAKDYLGVENPEDMQSLVSDFDKFYETAKELKKNSDGKVYMVSSVSDLLYPFEALRETGWAKDGKFVLDEKMVELMDLGKKLVEEKLTLDTEYTSEAWYAGMSSDNIMGYPLPTWGLHYWLEPNSKSESTGNSTYGDWKMVKGPASYFSGGTWLGIVDSSDMKEEAADLIDYIINNEEFLESYTKEVGDVISNRNVVEKVKDGFENEFLGGQNHYEEFATMIDDISGETVTEYDRTISKMYQDEALIPYSKGEVDKETAIKNFKAAVQNSYPDLEVK